MGDNSAIEWTDATWNPVVGCSIVSPGCTNCYAMREAHRLGSNPKLHGKYRGLTRVVNGNPVWTGTVRLHKDALLQPLAWKKPRRIFVNSMSDLFHEGLRQEDIDRVFAVMALCPQHTFQVLTKRSHRMREWFAERWQGTPAQRYKVGDTVFDVPAGGETGRRSQVEEACEAILERFPKMVDTENDALWDENGSLKICSFGWPLPNVWLGVSAEDQGYAEMRIPDLLATPAAVRFVSAEPLLGEIALDFLVTKIEASDDDAPEVTTITDALQGYIGRGVDGWVRWSVPDNRPRLDWVIAGGESGPKARPTHPDWIRGLRDQCVRAGVPFFFKQWGEWEPRKEWSGHLGGGRFETMLAIMPDGSQCPHDVVPQDVGAHRMALVGKSKAGAQLDGREWRELPSSSSPLSGEVSATEGS